MLEFNRPIVFFDIESTGLSTTDDRIVEISVHKVGIDGEAESKTRRVNPGIPISPQATEVHGITDEDVKDMPPFNKIAKSLHDLIQGCDIGGFNSNRFDCPMLYNEFRRAGINWNYKQHHFIDVGNIFKIMEPRTLEAAVKFYLNREHDGAHGAAADTQATAEVFFHMINKYKAELPDTVDQLELFCNYDAPLMDLSGKFTSDKDGTILLNFGKYRGERAEDHPDFLQWIMSKDFPPDTVQVCEHVLNQSYYGK